MEIIKKDGFEFTPVKIGVGLWTVNLILNGKPEIKAASGKTKKEAIATFHKLADKVDVKECIKIYKINQVRTKFWHSKKIQDLFKHHFKVELNTFRCHYISYPAIDIVRFDKWLKTPDNISTSDYITDKYGAQATRLIQKLIGVK